MIIGILKEPIEEKRVVTLPEIAGQLAKLNFEVFVETGAGSRAFAADTDYQQAGAKISSREEIISNADLILSINRPTDAELSKMKPGAMLLAVFQPLFNKELVQQLIDKNLTSFSMDMVPRTSRAQSMDILSSQATVAGYKAVLTAAIALPKFFPMFMTAAGSITPARVLILGAGVAGLQAIATSRRLGAVVEAFDTRSAVKEEVKSLGAKFIEVEGAAESAAAGGYAVEQSKEYLEKQKQKIYDSAVKADVIICTAQIPGRKAPVLIPATTVNAMKAGAVIVDLAASTGGNCELCKNNETIQTPNGVTIIGDSNLPANMPSDASKMFGKNVMNFLKLMLKDGQINLNFEDDIVKGTCITHNKEIISSRVQEALAVKTA
ncbi:MAG: Re/Si-specific NAD(P)(+) transhydrogenase subunit alpha [Chitinophagaceae bacterium]|nr:Re/Si-specific NAD(P)(+) transhydrogenase subunit alpha [Chitinophagaceae bacterium]